MFDSCDVAAYIAQECVERKISYTNTKIQKLVFPRVFKLIHNGCDVTEYSRVVRDRGSEEIKATVQKVLEVFGPLRASNLSAWSHCVGSPWWKVTGGQVDRLDRIVSDALIRKFFVENVLVAGSSPIAEP